MYGQIGSAIKAALLAKFPELVASADFPKDGEDPSPFALWLANQLNDDKCARWYKVYYVGLAHGMAGKVLSDAEMQPIRELHDMLTALIRQDAVH